MAPSSAPATRRGRKRGAPETVTSVIVPRAVYPTETCDENGGDGWSATAVPHGRGTSKVSFTHARDEGGAPFGVVYLRSACLLPLTEEGTGGPAPTIVQMQGGGTGGKRSRRRAGLATPAKGRVSPAPLPSIGAEGNSTCGGEERPRPARMSSSLARRREPGATPPQRAPQEEGQVARGVSPQPRKSPSRRSKP